MMDNVDLPPPYSAVVDVPVPSPDALVPAEEAETEANEQAVRTEEVETVENMQEITPKDKVIIQTNDVEPIVDHPFNNKVVRVAFIQKIMLLLFLQALSSLIIMAPFAYNLYDYRSIYALIFLFIYLGMMGVLLISHKARKTNPYNVILFVAYPVTLVLLICFTNLGYSIREMFLAMSCHCVALFALLAYSVLILQTSLEYRPDGGTFITTAVLVTLFVLPMQFSALDKGFVALYMMIMLIDCAYTSWEINQITSPKYRHAVGPSDIILGVLLIRIDLVYNILMCIRKCWFKVVGFEDYA